MLVSGEQQSDSVTHIHTFFSIIGYYRILSKVLCALKQVFVDYIFYI